MLDYASLSALAAVVQEGSFERAARALHVTPSAVSQRIRLLEEHVGCALVVRGQPCQATETGRRLCRHVDRVRLLEHELHGELPILEQDEITRVPLPVAVNADSLATWFAPAVTHFAAGAPVLMEVAVDDQDHTAEWLRYGKVLAAVTATARPASGCNSHPLGAMRYLAAASPAFMGKRCASTVCSTIPDLSMIETEGTNNLCPQISLWTQSFNPLLTVRSAAAIAIIQSTSSVLSSNSR